MAGLRLAAFQRQPLFHDIAGAVARLLADLAWCDGEGVDLALFPECYLQGYALDRPTINDVALELEGEALRELLPRFARVRASFVLGLIERAGQSIFNTAVVVRHGTLLGAYRKTHLHRKEDAFEAGRDYPIFEVGEWRFGVNICYDANFPDAAATIAHQGARLICYPLNNMMAPDVADRWRTKSIENLSARAAETGCWIASSDVVGRQDSLLCHGCTCIVDPKGEVVARVEEGEEGMALFDCA